MERTSLRETIIIAMPLRSEQATSNLGKLSLCRRARRGRVGPFSQRAKPLAVVGGCRLAKPASSSASMPGGARCRLTAVRTTAPSPGSPRAGSRHANPMAAMERGRLWKVPPLPETRSNCARVPAAAWKPEAPTTSHSPSGGLTGNDEPAGWVPVTLSKRSLNLLWFTGLLATGWESGRHVSIKDQANPDRALARSLRRG